MEAIVAPLLLLIIAIIGWVINYLNPQKKSTSQLILMSLLLILLVISGMWTIGKSYKDNKEKEELNKRNEKLSAEIQASQSRAEHQISTILRLLGLDPEKLLERYPLGYVIFDINYKNEVFPYEKQLLDKYELNWDVVELTRPTKETFKLRLPDFQKKNGSGTTDIYITGPLKGTLEEEKPFDNGIAIGKVMMLSRILEVRNDGIIFIIGFTEWQPPQFK